MDLKQTLQGMHDDSALALQQLAKYEILLGAHDANLPVTCRVTTEYSANEHSVNDMGRTVEETVLAGDELAAAVTQVGHEVVRLVQSLAADAKNAEEFIAQMVAQGAS